MVAMQCRCVWPRRYAGQVLQVTCKAKALLMMGVNKTERKAFFGCTSQPALSMLYIQGYRTAFTHLYMYSSKEGVVYIAVVSLGGDATWLSCSLQYIQASFCLTRQRSTHTAQNKEEVAPAHALFNSDNNLVLRQL